LQAIVHAVRWAVEAALRPLDALPAAVSLSATAALTALAMLVVVKHVSPQALIARARDRMAACIYEIRLFLDAPGRVLRAQGRLLGWTVVYMAALLPAALVLTPPLGLLYLHLETRHGLVPLPAPSTVVLRVELAPGREREPLAIRGDDAIRVTAPLVRAPDEHAVYARLAIAAPGTHRVTVTAGAERVAKRLDAGPSAAVAPERAGGWRHLVSLGDEPPPDGDAIRSISVRHPASEAGLLGLAVPWWLYWLGSATVLALLLRRRLGVAM
jgi:hypothetical protein